MTTQLDPVYILKLLKVSSLFTDDQKKQIKAKLPSLSVTKIEELFSILEREAQTENKYLQRVLDAKKKFAHQKIKALYNYAESKVQEDEETHLADLDAELEALPN